MINRGRSAPEKVSRTSRPTPTGHEKLYQELRTFRWLRQLTSAGYEVLRGGIRRAKSRNALFRGGGPRTGRRVFICPPRAPSPHSRPPGHGRLVRAGIIFRTAVPLLNELFRGPGGEHPGTTRPTGRENTLSRAVGSKGDAGKKRPARFAAYPTLFPGGGLG